jgi:hypothetical protein
MIQWFLRLFVLDRVIMRWLFRLRAEGLKRLPEEGLFDAQTTSATSTRSW